MELLRTIKEAQVDPVQRTAESITKIINFLLFRVPQKDKKRFLGRIKGKIIRLPAGQIGLKQMPPTATVGQAISLTKQILTGLNPFFVKQVLDAVGRNIERVRDIHQPAPPSLLPQVGGKYSTSGLSLSKRAIDVAVEPMDAQVQAAVQKIKQSYPGILNRVKKITIHPGTHSHLGHVESGIDKDPQEIHLFKGTIEQQLKQQLKGAKPTLPQYQDMLVEAIIEVIGHEAGHIGEQERTPEQMRSMPFHGEGEAEMKSREVLRRVFPQKQFADDNDAILEWMKSNIKDPKNNCFFYAGTMAILFPKLKLMKGKPQFSGETAHFWTELDGRIIDPTKDQYNKEIDYSEGESIDAIKNADFIMNDPMFKTLDPSDQAKIKRVSTVPDHLRTCRRREIARLVGLIFDIVGCRAFDEGFGKALLLWQERRGLEPSGELDNTTITYIRGRLPISSNLPRNFGLVCLKPQILCRGALPESPEQIRLLRDGFGIRRIVSLDMRFPEIAQWCSELGIEHVLVNLVQGAHGEEGWNTIGSNMVEFLESSPTFIHCRHGRDRTGGVLSRYRTEKGWPCDLAHAEARAYGFRDIFVDMLDRMVDACQCTCNHRHPPINTAWIRDVVGSQLGKTMEQNLIEPVPNDLQLNTENQGYSSGPGSLLGNPYGIRSIPVANEGGGR